MESTICIPTSAVYVAAGLLVVFFLLKGFLPVGLWIAATAAGAPIPLTHLMGMRLRRVKPAAIVHPYINGVKAGLRLNPLEMEALHLAGGDVSSAVDAMIRANHGGASLTWEEAAKEQLKDVGRDVFDDR